MLPTPTVAGLPERDQGGVPPSSASVITTLAGAWNQRTARGRHSSQATAPRPALTTATPDCLTALNSAAARRPPQRHLSAVRTRRGIYDTPPPDYACTRWCDAPTDLGWWRRSSRTRGRIGRGRCRIGELILVAVGQVQIPSDSRVLDIVARDDGRPGHQLLWARWLAGL